MLKRLEQKNRLKPQAQGGCLALQDNRDILILISMALEDLAECIKQNTILRNAREANAVNCRLQGFVRTKSVARSESLSVFTVNILQGSSRA